MMMMLMLVLMVEVALTPSWPRTSSSCHEELGAYKLSNRQYCP